ncbi:tripartite tricarboxylate transporter TctB family protein [Corynebacterium hindlerae]|uniref:tripartite tricarboxylate transporter TctB family protein n=1 Tax=Corynebacterium hindlerae TaxID=699041 RepID=UPI003AAEAD21
MISDDVPANSGNDASPYGIEETHLRDGHPRIALAVLAVIGLGGIALAIYSFFFLGVGSLAQPQAGMFLAVSAIIILISLPAAYLAKDTFEVFNFLRVSRTIMMIVGLCSFVVLMDFAGFIIAGFVSLIIITRYSAQESWRNVLIISILTPIVLWGLFGYLFQVTMPPLPTWLG